MCGICGVTTENNDLLMGDVRIKKMVQSISHRGPDEKFYTKGSGYALGIARLSITNPMNGTQPAFNENKSVVAILNGQIFNYLEIKNILLGKGHVIEDGSDVQILPHAYEEWGLNFPQYLNGDFAISILDLNQKTVLLARDRFGVKPLYYSVSKKGAFVFASEVKAILSSGLSDRQLNPSAILDLFTFWSTLEGDSVFSGVNQVKAGFIETFNFLGGKKKSFQYWDFPTSSLDIQLNNYSNASEAFWDAFRASVSLRLPSDVPFGTYTSGGVDSSLINAAVSDVRLGSPWKTFSVNFGDHLYDESRYQDAIAKKFNLQHHCKTVIQESIRQNIESCVYHAESPLFRTAPVPMYMLSGLVKENGIKVILTGEGADEVLCGYDIFKEQKVRRFCSRQPNSESRMKLFGRMYGYLPQFSNPRYAALSSEFFRYRLNETANPIYSHLLRIKNSVSSHRFLSESFLSLAGNASDSENRLISSLPTDFLSKTELEKVQYIEHKTLLQGYLLSVQGDRMMSAHGVEGRFPYLDHKFVDLCSRLPEGFKLRGMTDKKILRDTAEKVIPREFAFREKHAYRAPGVQFAINDEMLDKYLNKAAIDETAVFSWEASKNLIKKAIQTPSKFTTVDEISLCQLVSTQILYSKFISE